MKRPNKLQTSVIVAAVAMLTNVSLLAAEEPAPPPPPYPTPSPMAPDLSKPRPLVPPAPVCFAGMTLDQICQKFPPQNKATGSCRSGTCFSMSYGAEARTVIVDNKTPYPKSWTFFWPKGTLTAQSGKPPCELVSVPHPAGTKAMKVTIPDNEIRCLSEFSTPTRVYYEHFVSNPDSSCLAWIECVVVLKAEKGAPHK